MYDRPRPEIRRHPPVGLPRPRHLPSAVLASPQCTPFFDSVPGGVPFVLQALRASPSPEARAFLLRYDDPAFPMRYRLALPLEAFCIAAAVCPSRLIKVAVGAIAEHRLLRGAVIAAMAHSDIMATNVSVAREAEGVEDRMAHFKMVGAMPAPRGASTVVNVNASATADSRALAASAAPPAEDTIRRMVEARQRQAALTGTQRELPAAPSPAVTLPVAFQPKPRVAVPVTLDAFADADEDADVPSL